MFLKFPACAIFLKQLCFASILIHQDETNGPVLQIKTINNKQFMITQYNHNQ